MNSFVFMTNIMYSDVYWLRFVLLGACVGPGSLPDRRPDREASVAAVCREALLALDRACLRHGQSPY